MKHWTYWFLAIALHLLVVVCTSPDNEEPHAYTISFFQFDPKDIGAGSDVKKESKKDIKPSDVKLINQLGNDTVIGNNTLKYTRNTTEAVEKEQPNHMHWNTTDPSTSNPQPTNNQTKPPQAAVSDYQSYKKNETDLDSKNIKEHNKTKEENIEGKSDIHSNNTVENGGETQNKTQGLSKLKNETFVETVNQTMAAGLNINNATESHLMRNDLNSSNHLSLNNSSIKPENTTTTNGTVKRTKISSHSYVASGVKKALVLNPNPSPSQTEAAQHLKTPQYQNSFHKTPQLKIIDNKLFEKNDTVAKNDTNSASLIEKSVTLTKAGAAKENKTETERKPIESDKKEKDKGQTVIVKQMDAKNNNNNTTTKNETAEKSKKLEKDKKTNQEILEKAKQIKPVENHVDVNNTTVITHNASNAISGIKKHQILKKNKAIQHHPQNKSQIQRHRQILSHFIPVYDINPIERSLGFQLGSLKHPKHDTFPKCHHCPRNSTYSRCVKQATLKRCNKGLNNICFTKSHRRNGHITYQMGCADHKKCINARAFPCKDGSKDCFTCCQFDRCNSSPHHGDYELDELNMAEVQLDTTNNKGKLLTGNWFYQLVIILVQVLVLKIVN